MTEYSVEQIANLLSVDCETVRRWIRNGRLKASIGCRKGGYFIGENDLREFLDHNHKYATKFNSEKGEPTMNENNVNQFINGIGALGETAGMLVGSFMNNGFSREESINLAKDILIAIFVNGNKEKKDK